MKSASELLEAYLNTSAPQGIGGSVCRGWRTRKLPWVNAHAQGPAAVEKLLNGSARQGSRLSLQESDLLQSQTPDKVAAEIPCRSQGSLNRENLQADLRRCTARAERQD